MTKEIKRHFDVAKINKGSHDTCDFCHKRHYYPCNVYFLTNVGAEVGACGKCAELGNDILIEWDMCYSTEHQDEHDLVEGKATNSTLARLYQKYPERIKAIQSYVDRTYKKESL